MDYGASELHTKKIIIEASKIVSHLFLREFRLNAMYNKL